jgi:signal peptidase I
VNDQPIDFGSDADYTPDPPPSEYEPEDRLQEGWTRANDIDAPASLGAKGEVSFSGLKLWRDTYFTYSDGGPPFEGVAEYADSYYVQPQHYLCLGDNSAQSSDSRKWGTVPERLLLGRAVAIFFPLNRIGIIR